ncbi:hypothetical protein THAOC_29464, partial [Thalassiosira oceanica]
LVSCRSCHPGGVLGSVGLRWVLCKGPGEGQPASGEGPQGPEKGGNAELESEIEKLRSDNALLRRSRPPEVPTGKRETTRRKPRGASGRRGSCSYYHGRSNFLLFDVLLGGNIEHQNGDKTTIYGTRDDEYSVAVSSSYVMTSGSHYAEFQISGTSTFIGIVRPMPGLDAAAYQEADFAFIGRSRFTHDFLAQRSNGWGDGNVHVCEYVCSHGKKYWTDWEGVFEWEDWDGMEGCNDGDTVGMLLNLDEGTLTVYKNNRRLGVMKDGLSGSYCWHAGMGQDGNTVTISRARIPTTARSSPN